MHKALMLVLSLLCTALAAISFYFKSELDSERHARIAESQARAKLELRAAEGSGWAANGRSPRDSFPPTAQAQQDIGPRADFSSGLVESRPAPPGFDGRMRFASEGNPFPGGGVRVSPGLMRSLHLTASEGEKLKSILAEQQAKIRASMERDGGPLDAQLLDYLKQETDRQVRDLLGDAKYQEYEDYRKYLQEHNRIEEFNTRLVDSGKDALPQSQQDKLFTMMKAARDAVPPQPTPAGFPTRDDFMNAMRDWRGTYDQLLQAQVQAQTLLTPEQLLLLQRTRGVPRR
jgi:hypothetical protein